MKEPVWKPLGNGQYVDGQGIIWTEPEYTWYRERISDAGPEPMFVWDVRDGFCSSAYWWNATGAIIWWNQNMPGYEHTFRAEFYLMDTPYVVLQQYLVNEKGHVVPFPNTGEPGKAEPKTVPLRELPPPELRTGCPGSGTCPIQKPRESCRMLGGEVVDLSCM